MGGRGGSSEGARVGFLPKGGAASVYRVDSAAARETVRRLGDVELRMVPISSVRDAAAYDAGKLARASEGIASGAAMPPVRLLKADGGGYTVSDGNHRIAAARAAGHTHVPAIVDAPRLRSTSQIQTVAKDGMRADSFARVRSERASGQRMRPIEVARYHDGRTVLTDGRHRLAVAREAGDRSISAVVRTYGPRGGLVGKKTERLTIDK